jgi:hypothetical protein
MVAEQSAALSKKDQAAWRIPAPSVRMRHLARDAANKESHPVVATRSGLLSG